MGSETAPSGPEAPSIELTDVTRAYRGPPPVPAVAGVSLSIRPGELVAVVGPSGSGKSTLLNLMSGLDQPSSGSVKVAGHDLAVLSDRALSGIRARMIGFVFQEFFLFPGATALENVAEGLRYLGVSGTARREEAEGALHRVRLGHRMHHLPEQLSGGGNASGWLSPEPWWGIRWRFSPMNPPATWTALPPGR